MLFFTTIFDHVNFCNHADQLRVSVVENAAQQYDVAELLQRMRG